jgi:2-dehydro-3-deoxygluconokinase
MPLPLKPKNACTFDQVSLGEIMLRLDPGEGRIRTARQFAVWEGGGEYNVARGLRKCFGLKTAVVTAFVDNEVGHLVEDCILQGGDPTTASGGRSATASTSPSGASASAGRWACPTGATRRPAR